MITVKTPDGRMIPYPDVKHARLHARENRTELTLYDGDHVVGYLDADGKDRKPEAKPEASKLTATEREAADRVARSERDADQAELVARERAAAARTLQAEAEAAEAEAGARLAKARARKAEAEAAELELEADEAPKHKGKAAGKG